MKSFSWKDFVRGQPHRLSIRARRREKVITFEHYFRHNDWADVHRMELPVNEARKLVKALEGLLPKEEPHG